MSKRRVRLAFETSVAWTRPPVSRQMRKLSTVPKASSPRSARAAQARPVEDLGDLRAAEVGVDREARPGAEEGLVTGGPERVAAAGRHPALPDDGVGDRSARRALPDDRRLALVGDADAGDRGRVRCRTPRARAERFRAGWTRWPRDRARPRAGPGRSGAAPRLPTRRSGRPVDEDRARRGRALVEGEDQRLVHRPPELRRRPDRGDRLRDLGRLVASAGSGTSYSRWADGEVASRSRRACSALDQSSSAPELGHTRSDLRSAVRQLQGEPGPARQDVIERQGRLRPGRRDDLDLEVGDVGSERSQQIELPTEADDLGRLGCRAGRPAGPHGWRRDPSRPRSGRPALRARRSTPRPTSGKLGVRDGRARATSRPSAASTVWAAISR